MTHAARYTTSQNRKSLKQHYLTNCSFVIQHLTNPYLVMLSTWPVRWAIDCKVDVISMSWTIELVHRADLAEPDPVQSAIKAAEGKNILMFCSASD